MPFLTDTHCHLASRRYDTGEIQGLLDAAKAAGVRRVVTLSTCWEDVERNLALAEFPGVHACVGIHPCDVTGEADDVMERLAAHGADPRVCAVGETGLDYHHPAPEGWEEGAYRRRQREFLERHFEWAAAAGLPVVIHTRDRSGRASFEDSLEIASAYQGRVRSLFHCFSGSEQEARRVLAINGLVSFGGVVTFRSASSIRDCVSALPAGSFVLETDAPYLAPEPYRGTRNEPAHVAETARFVAALRGETLEELAAHTHVAAEGFFRW